MSADDFDSVPVALPEESTLARRTGLDEIGLCLSGGGYRAMLYHAGALWRLNELGFLGRITRISSVSGGSITAGWLASLWAKRGWTGGAIPEKEFRDEFAGGLRELARTWIDVPSVLLGLVPGCNVGRVVARCYDRTLFGGLRLNQIPDTPRFVFNASNLQSGAVWRFTKPYMGDHRVGLIERPDVPLSWAVAASSAFPPFLSPFELKLKHTQFVPTRGADLSRPPFTTRPKLSDGGVYDNLGLETVFKSHGTVLVSDGGAPFSVKESPPSFWPLQVKRVLDCEDNQVRALRKRQLIDAYKNKLRRGAYWGIGTRLAAYSTPGPLVCNADKTEALAAVGTKLRPFDEALQERLINWGYASCAASLATNFPQPGPAAQWPYPNHPLS